MDRIHHRVPVRMVLCLKRRRRIRGISGPSSPEAYVRSSWSSYYCDVSAAPLVLLPLLSLPNCTLVPPTQHPRRVHFRNLNEANQRRNIKRSQHQMRRRKTRNLEDISTTAMRPTAHSKWRTSAVVRVRMTSISKTSLRTRTTRTRKSFGSRSRTNSALKVTLFYVNSYTEFA